MFLERQIIVYYPIVGADAHIGPYRNHHLDGDDFGQIPSIYGKSVH
jgi:hypothetical protein